MENWNQKMESEKPLMPSTSRDIPVQPSSRKLRLLEKTRRLVLFSGIAAFGTWAVVGYSTSWTGPAPHRNCHFEAEKGKDFKWEDVTPTSHLEYHPCWDGFECARLEVPLDWENPDNGLKAAVAIVKVPAKVDERSEEWGGPVLINPGGPGGSGTNFAISRGKELQTILGPQFSIVGFDPRGINNTTPSMSCFNTHMEQSIWGIKSGGRILGSTDSGEEVGEAYARSMTIGAMCNITMGGEGLAGVGKYVGTPVVARDMLEITEGEWDRVGKDGSKKGLRYWGFSYGSVLGTTFASMFPDRIERLAVDGICDVEDYYKSGWMTNLQDAEKVVSSFYNYCSLAGPLRCSFHTGTTADDVSTRLSTLMARLRRQPLPVPDAPTGAEVVTYSDVKTMFFTALYKPLTSFPKIAKILVDIEAGDGKSFIEYQKKQFSCNCGGGGPERPPGPDFDAIWAIACSDGEQVEDSLDEMYEYLHMLQEQSPTSGGSWAVVRMGCAGWKIRPQGLVYNGPISGNTSWPLLFLGNSADPVTPVRNAHKMAKGFEGSVVLEQNSEGHCSISTPSVCSMKYIRDYFVDGKLPPKDTVCEADVRPFFDGEKAIRAMSEEDRILFDAVSELGKGLVTPNFMI
ncbi:uncharacterized protein LAJ45_04819 [Morchella importuna]|uniref:Alpha/beta-hydrolase n=1 Tax=Morchella conica CCBAS932 TaxID=1392247 RepID=A0A3N4KTV9_9PEZI|nr:uncharacterized protein LAJ45_04819 [Morchella importuna]KAH8151117.1 hypothetical protein LAJ45_04819 [Morchella importuna]RPB09215.1 hypothetical protein P167DRAFT_538682 [Morchella conica CCBAS932]